MQPTPDLNENPTIVVCGSIHLDTLVRVDSVPAEGGTLIVGGGTNSLGGKGVNQAAAIVYDDVHAVMAGTVGEGCTADVVVEEPNARDVDVHSIQTPWSLPTGSAFVIVNRKRWPVILVQRGANALTDPTDFVGEFAFADVVLAQGELLLETAEAIAFVAPMHNARLVLSLDPVTTVTSALIDHAGPLIVNMKGAWEAIRRLDIAESIHATDYRVQFEALLQYYPSIVILRGDNGCFLIQHSDGLDNDLTIYEHPTFKLPEGKIVDGIDSDNAFAGTLTAELAKDTSLYDAVPLATTAGTAVVQAVGTCSAFVRRDKLLEMVEAEDFPAIRVY